MKKFLFLLLCLLSQLASAQELGAYSFEGTLDGKIPVRISFWVNTDSIAVGEIYYPKAKRPAPILLVGSMLDHGFFTLKEYQADGVITGFIEMVIEGESSMSGPWVKEGTWTNPRTEKVYHLTGMKKCPLPDDLLDRYTYADPQHIGRRYSYQVWQPVQQCMVGGHVNFRGAGKHKLHFDIVNVPRNIAEGGSRLGRPAELTPFTYNSFVYRNVNECGYAFKATFFNKFVVIRTISGYESLDCFGAGASFDGVYVMVKE